MKTNCCITTWLKWILQKEGKVTRMYYFSRVFVCVCYGWLQRGEYSFEFDHVTEYYININNEREKWSRRHIPDLRRRNVIQVFFMEFVYFDKKIVMRRINVNKMRKMVLGEQFHQFSRRMREFFCILHDLIERLVTNLGKLYNWS